MDGHGEVKCLFRAVFIHIKPADEFVRVSHRLRRGLRRAAVGHGLHVAVADDDGRILVNRQPCCDRVGHGNPICVQHKGLCGHSGVFKAETLLHGLINVPAVKCIRAGFERRGIFRNKIFAGYVRLIKLRARLCDCAVVHECQRIAVARVVQVCLVVSIKVRHNIVSLCKPGYGEIVLIIRQADAAALYSGRIIEVIGLSAVCSGCKSRGDLSGQNLKVVVPRVGIAAPQCLGHGYVLTGHFFKEGIILVRYAGLENIALIKQCLYGIVLPDICDIRIILCCHSVIGVA